MCFKNQHSLPKLCHNSSRRLRHIVFGTWNMDLELFDIFKFSVCNDIKISWHAVIKAAARSDTEVVSETTKAGGLRGKLNKVVLAYSGGLDTSVIVPWLRYRCCPPFTPIFLLDLSCAFVIFDFSSPLYILKSEWRIVESLWT